MGPGNTPEVAADFLKEQWDKSANSESKRKFSKKRKTHTERENQTDFINKILSHSLKIIFFLGTHTSRAFSIKNVTHHHPETLSTTAYSLPKSALLK